MRQYARQRRWLAVLMLATFLLAGAPGSPATPTAVQAEVSADPAEELVYIDANGVIKVLDTSVTGTSPQVQWFSPTNGWRDNIALGDVNNDGDMEIIGIGGGSSDGKLAVFDPVVASGATKPDQKINGIPWDTLYQTTVPGTPELVDTGNFDENVLGPEIIYFYELQGNSEDNLRMIVLKADSPTPTGRGWLQHLSGDFEEQWEQLAVGNLDDENTDEFAVVSEEDANMQVFRVDGGLQRFFEEGSDSRPPKMVAIGLWEEDESPMFVYSRDAGPPLPAVLVLRFDRLEDDEDEREEIYTESFEPSPRAGFFADIDGSGEQKLVLLRNVQSNQNSPRMIVRGREDEDIPDELEQRLDSDNGYRAGAGGDTDGDGKDEIVLIRDNRILVFYEAERSARTNSYSLSTNRRSIRIGDLDKNGFNVGNQFAADRTLVEATLAAGGPAKGETVNLTNASGATPIPFTITTVGNPSWLIVGPSVGQTPTALGLTFVDTGLAAGVYTSTLVIASSDSTVINQPFRIEVKLTVTAALVSVNPTAVSFSYLCGDTTSLPPRIITVGGAGGIQYTATILGTPTVAAAQSALSGPFYDAYVADDGTLMVRDGAGNEAPLGPASQVMASGATAQWPSSVPGLSASSASDTIPDTITLTVSRMATETIGYQEAALVLYADSRAGAPPGNIRVVQISTFCAKEILYMPTVFR